MTPTSDGCIYYTKVNKLGCSRNSNWFSSQCMGVDEPHASCMIIHFKVSVLKCQLVCEFGMAEGFFYGFLAFMHVLHHTKFCLFLFSHMLLLWNSFFYTNYLVLSFSIGTVANLYNYRMEQRQRKKCVFGSESTEMPEKIFHYFVIKKTGPHKWKFKAAVTEMCLTISIW